MDTQTEGLEGKRKKKKAVFWYEYNWLSSGSGMSGHFYFNVH